MNLFNGFETFDPVNDVAVHGITATHEWHTQATVGR